VVPADKASEERMLSLRLEASLASIKKRQAAKGEELSPSEVESKKKSLLKHLADGPGKLCIAMGVNKQQNDVDMVESTSFYVTEGVTVLPEEIQAGKRIGIDYAEEAADYLWRFYIRE
jgi:3-methyladenine DNA glycosylase Mpg